MKISCKLCDKPFSGANESQVLMFMQQHLVGAHPEQASDLAATVKVLTTYFLIRMFVSAEPTEAEFIEVFRQNETAILELFASPAVRPVD